MLISNALWPTQPHDYWWALVMGRFVDTQHALPDANLFLYTMPADAPFFDQPWLAQWLLYRVWLLAGHLGPPTLHVLALLATWLPLLAVTLRRSQEPRLVGTMALPAVLLSNIVFSVRTQMFAFPCFSLLLVGLLGLRDGTLRFSPKIILALAALTALWANLHGSFVLAPVLAGLLGGGQQLQLLLEERRLDRPSILRWSALVLALLVAGCLTPHGPGVYLYVLHLTLGSDVATTTSEWLPLQISDPLGPVFGLFLLACLVILALRREHLGLGEALLFAAGCWLGSGQQRSLFWFAALALPIVTPQLRGLLRMPPWSLEEARATTSRLQAGAHAVVLAAAAAFVLLALPPMPSHPTLARIGFGHLARLEPPDQLVLHRDNASRLLARLQREGFSGRLFHEQGLGGQIEFALAPASGGQVAFVDQRLEMIPPQIWEDYHHIEEARPGWQQRLDAHQIDALLLHSFEQWPLVQAVQREAGWRLVESDGVHLLFTRRADR